MSNEIRSTIEEIAGPRASATDTYLCWRRFVNLAGGEDHGLKVGVIVNGSQEIKVEILGLLPLALSRGLKRAIPYWKPLRRGQISWAQCDITWCPNLVGKGPRFAIPNSAVLLELLVARRKILSEGVA